MMISYSENNTHVEDSYKIIDIDLVVSYIMGERFIKNLPITRSFESYVREWKGHNNLYNIGLFRSHTKDVDLNENNSIIEEVIWLIIGR